MIYKIKKFIKNFLRFFFYLNEYFFQKIPNFKKYQK